MLDQMSDGRLDLGVGRGVSRLEVKLYNVDPDKTRAMFDEALEVIKRGLTSPTLDFSGEFYDYDTVPMASGKPVAAAPMPPIRTRPAGLASVERGGQERLEHRLRRRARPHRRAGHGPTPEHLDPELRGRTKYGIHPFIAVAPTDAEAMRVGESA